MVRPPANNGWDAWSGTQIRTSEYSIIVDYLINRDARISTNCHSCGKIIPAGTVFIRTGENNDYCDRHCFKKALDQNDDNKDAKQVLKAIAEFLKPYLKDEQ